MSPANARTNHYGHQLAVKHYLAGHRVKDIAGQLGISRTTVEKWIARYAAEGAGSRRSGTAGCARGLRVVRGPALALGRCSGRSYAQEARSPAAR